MLSIVFDRLVSTLWPSQAADGREGGIPRLVVVVGLAVLSWALLIMIAFAGLWLLRTLGLIGV